MKHFFLTILTTLFYWIAFAQPQQYLNHQNYDVIYSNDGHIALSVVYTLTKPGPSATRVPRFTHFTSDPQIPGSNFSTAYRKAGYDKGHMMSAASNQFDQQGMKESFFFTNVTPQTPKLNRGHWKTIENLERGLRDDFPYVKVICGNIFSEHSNRIGNGTVVVPYYCWKVLITPATALKLADTICYLFPNRKELDDDIDIYRTDYKDIEPDMPYKLNDLIGMYECPDQGALQNYMASMLQARLDLQYKTDIGIEEVIDRYEYKFKDDENFRKEMRKKGIEVPEGMSMREYARNDFDQSRATLDKQYALMKQETSNLRSPQDILAFLSSPDRTTSTISICSLCHLPTSVPVCLMPRPR